MGRCAGVIAEVAARLMRRRVLVRNWDRNIA
jgi:hypothetical protein